MQFSTNSASSSSLVLVWMLVMLSPSTARRPSSIGPLCKPVSPHGVNFQNNGSVLGAVKSVSSKASGRSPLQPAPSAATSGSRGAVPHLHLTFSPRPSICFGEKQNVPHMLTPQLAHTYAGMI